MPRSQSDPFIKILQFFEDAPLATLTLSLSVVKEIVRRRLTGETVIRQDGTARIDVPLVRKKRGPNKKKKAGVASAAAEPDPAVEG